MQAKQTVMFDMSPHLTDLREMVGDNQKGVQALTWFVRCLLCRGNAHDMDPRDVLITYLGAHFGEGFLFSDNTAHIFENIRNGIALRLRGFDPYDSRAYCLKVSDVQVNPLGVVKIHVPEDLCRRWL